MQYHGFDTALLSLGHTNLELIYLLNNPQIESRAKKTGRKSREAKESSWSSAICKGLWEGHALKSNVHLHGEVPRKGSYYTA